MIRKLPNVDIVAKNVTMRESIGSKKSQKVKKIEKNFLKEIS